MNNDEFKNFVESIDAKIIIEKAKEFIKDAVKVEIIMKAKEEDK